MKKAILIFGLFVSIFSFGQNPDLVFKFPLDGSTIDVSGNNRSGTIVGGVTPTTDRFGNANGAYLFDGATGFIDIPYTIGIGTSDFTVTFWSYQDALTQGLALSKDRSGDGTAQFRLGYHTSGDILQSNVGNIPYPPPTGSWMFFTMVRSGMVTSFYANGSFISSVTNTTLINLSNTYNYRIGARYLDGTTTAGKDFFKGKIDEVTMYNRALSATEIATNYANGSPNKGLLAWYKLDNNSVDSSGNGINLVSHNVTGTTDRFGNANAALKLDGVDNPGYIDALDTKLNVSTAFSFSCWLNLASFRGTDGNGNTTTVGSNQSIFSKAGDLSSGGSLLLNSTSGFFFASNGTTSSTTVVNNTNYVSTLLNNWVHAVLVLTQNTEKIYVDGILVYSATGTFNPAYMNGKGLSIGRHYNSGWYPLNGTLDDVKIFNRELSATEVSKLYTQNDIIASYTANTGVIKDESPVAWNSTVGTGVTLTTDRFGTKTAMAFDGTANGNITIPNSSAAFNTLPLGISFWMNASNITSTQGLINKYYAGAYNGFSVILINNLLTVWYYKDANNGIVSGACQKAILANTWYHVAVNYETTGAKLYVNGELAASAAWTGTPAISTTTEDLKFGTCPVGFNYTGKLDDIRILNRTLTTNEINNYYTEGGGNLKTGLIAYFPFNGNAKDSVSGTACTLNGKPTLATNRFGKANSAYYFDGGSNLSFASFGLKIPTNGISISLWAKTPIGSSGNSAFCLSDDGNNTTQSNANRLNAHLRWTYNTNPTLSNIYWDYGDISTTTAAINGRIWLPNAPMVDNTWEHFVLISGSTGMQIYRNGVLIQSGTNHGSFTPSDVALLIGGKGGAGNPFYNGTLDDIKIYNRPLQASEVLSLYTEDGGNKTAGIQAYYPYDGNALDSISGTGSTAVGTVNAVPNRFGKANSAYQFPKSWYTTQLKQTNITEYSISTWVKMNDGEVGEIINNRTDLNDTTCRALTLSVETDNTLFLGINGADKLVGTFITKKINDGTWHHIVGVFKGTRGIAVTQANFNVYVDGVLMTYLSHANDNIGMAAGQKPPFNGNGNTRIGNIGTVLNGSNNNCILDQVRIFDRVLSQQEITDYYKEGGYTPQNALNLANTTGTLSSATTGQYASVPSGTWFNSDFTFDTWINLRTNFTKWERIIDFGSGQGINNILFTIGNDGVSASNLISTNPCIAIYEGQTPHNYYVTTALPLNAWTHVAVTLKGTTLTVYYNGVIVSTFTNVFPPQAVTRSLNYIGKSNWPGDYYMNASLDEFRLYNIALSQDSIVARSHRHLTGKESGLVLYYDFNQTIGTSVTDLTGNGNNATLFNTPAFSPSVALLSPFVRSATNITSTGFTANWDAVPTATSYDIEYAATSDFANATKVSQATASPLAITTTYSPVYFHVRANTATQTSEWSATTYYTLPGAALNLTNATLTTSSVSTGQYAVVPSGAWFNGDFTFDTWVKVQNSNYNDRIFDFGDATHSDNIVLKASPTSLGTEFNIYKSGVLTALNSPISLNNGLWNHIAITLKGSVATFYINGVQVAQNTTMNIPNNVTRTSCLIGKANWTNDPYGSMLLDEFRIYNVALSQDSIVARSHRHLNGNESGLILYYDFDQQAVSSVKNKATATVNADATVVNAATFVESKALLTPFIRTATNATAASFTANWDAVPFATKYELQYANNPFFLPFNTLTSKTNSTQITGLVAGVTYYYRVHALTATQASDWSPTSSTIPNNGLTFDGVDDYILLPTNASFNTSGASNYTVSAWVNPRAGTATIYSKKTDGNYYTQQIGFYVNGSKLNVAIDDYNGNGWQVLTSNNTIPNNSWSHVAFTLNNGVVSIYVNGVLDNTLTLNASHKASKASTGVTTIGGNGAMIGYAAESLDQVAIWNTALTQTQIANTMDSTIANPKATAGLIAYYQFNQGSATSTNTGLTTLTDASANGLNATLYNFALSGTTSNWVNGYVVSNPGGYAMSCDGTNYATLPYSAAYNPSTFTISFWAKPNDPLNSNYQSPLGSRNEGTTPMQGYNFYIQSSTAEQNQWAFWMHNGGAYPAWTLLTGTKAITNQWQHVAVTYDGTTAKLFVNGILSSSKATAYVPNTGMPLFIGSLASGQLNYNGSIDELSFWNKAINDTMISAMSHKSYTIQDKTGLTAYFDFNQPGITSTSLNENVSNTTIGTLVSAATTQVPTFVASTALITPLIHDAANVTFTGFTANWDAIPSATSYELQTATKSDFSDASTSIVTTKNSIAITRTVQTTYYRVRAINANQTSEWATSSSSINPGNALSFSNVSTNKTTPQYAQLPAGVWFNGDFTVDSWVYLKDYSDGGYLRLFDFGNGSGGDNILFAVNSSLGADFSIRNGTTVIKDNFMTPVPLNKWTHVAMSMKGDSAFIYYDGVSVGKFLVGAHPLNVSRANNYIAKSNWSSEATPNMLVDEFRIYNKYLTQDTIIARSHRHLTGKEDSLILYLDFDKVINGNSIADLSAKKNYATLYNGATTVVSNALISPSVRNATNITPTSFTANWDAIPNATSYEVQIATKYDFSDATSQTLTSNSLVIPIMQPVFYYKVRALNALQTSDWSTGTSPNLLSNPGAESLYSSWTRTDGGSGWGISYGMNNSPYSWISSYSNCTLSQTVDLVAKGYSATYLDTQPEINAGVYVASSGTITIKVELLDATGAVKSTNYISNNEYFSASWTLKSTKLNSYGTGVRFVRFTMVGKDALNWAGQYGPMFDNAFVSINSVKPIAVTNITTKNTTTTINGNWDAIANATKYEVQFAINAAIIKTITTTTNSFKLDSLTEGTAYSFKVRAFTPTQISDWATATTTTQFVPPGNALSLSGATQYAQAPTGAWFKGNFTVSSWVYLRSKPALCRIFDFGNGQPSNNILFDPTRNIFSIYSGTNTGYITASKSIPTNQWVNVAITLSGDTATIYYNGEIVGQKAGMPAPLGVSTVNNYIGKSNWAGEQYLDGLVDEFKIYNTALSRDSIIAQSHKAVSSNQNGLILYYNFDQLNGTTIADVSKSNASGTLYNAATFATSKALLTPFVRKSSNITTTSFTTRWDSIPMASSYLVQRALDKNFTVGASAIVTVKNTSTTLSFATEGLKHYIRVRAINTPDSSEWAVDSVQCLQTSPGMAVTMDGADEAVVIKSATATYKSFMFWANLSEKTGVDYLFDLRDGSVTGYNGFFYSTTSGLSGVSKLLINGVPSSINSTDNLPRNQWINIYVELPATANPLLYLTMFKRVTIAEGMKGSFDELSIWNKALSTAEIQQYMHNAPQATASGLVGYFNFEGFSYGSQPDVYGKGLTATYTNSDYTNLVQSKALLTPFIKATSTITTSSYSLIWDKIPGASYQIENATLSDFSNANLLVSTDSIKTITGLTQGTDYFYRVRAITATDTSEWSSGATTTQFVPPGNALSFDGKADFVVLPLATSTTDDVTMEAWFYYNGPTSDYQFILLNGDAAKNGYGIFIDEKNYLHGIACGNEYLFSKQTITPNQWQHVALVHQKGEWSLYLNGVKIPIKGNTSIPYTPKGNTFIGADNTGIRNFNGLIDEVSIWNTALDSITIISNSHRSYNDIVDKKGLAAYYDFNQNSGTSIQEFVSNQTVGALKGSATFVSSNALLTPFIRTATNINNSSFVAHWDYVIDAKYELQYATRSDFGKAITVPASKNQLKVSALQNKTTYYYRVHAITGTQTSEWSTDSVTIYQIETDTTAKACSAFAWYNNTYTSSGNYTNTWSTKSNHDSVETLHLTILQPTNKILNITACDKYVLNNQTYTKSDTYYQVLTNDVGCDSTIKLILVINPLLQETKTVSACEQYQFNGKTYTKSGNYIDTVANAVGCSTIVTLQLTIFSKPTITISSASTSICVGTTTSIGASGASKYAWNTGSTVSKIAVNPTITTSYSVTGTDINSCINTASVVVTVNNLPTIQWSASNNKMVCIDGAPITLSVNALPKKGNGTFTPIDGLIYSTDTSATFTPSKTTAGIKSLNYSYTDGNGCIASIASSLEVYKTSVPAIKSISVISFPIPSDIALTFDVTSDSYSNVTWYNDPKDVTVLGTGNSYTPTKGIAYPGIPETSQNDSLVGGTYSYNYTQTINGCESQPAKAIITVTDCSAKAPIAGINPKPCTDATLVTNLSATVADALGTLSWFDGSDVFNANLLASATTTYAVTATKPGSYSYYVAEFDTVKKCYGAPTVVNLTINPRPIISVTASEASICSGNTTNVTASGATSYLWESSEIGKSITVLPKASGLYFVTGTDANGCTNTASTYITLKTPSYSTIDTAGCESLKFNDSLYTKTGTYIQTVKNAEGCDSTITINVTINKPTASTLTITECRKYVLNGKSYNTSGTYTQLVKKANGCDSTITLQLTIVKPIINNISASAVGSYVFKNKTIKVSGIYTDTLKSITTSCDSIVVLNLTIQKSLTLISQIVAPQSVGMQVGTKQQLSVTVLPDNAYDKSLVYQSLDSTIVKVNKSGQLTAIKSGFAYVSISSISSSLRSLCMINVTDTIVPLQTFTIPSSMTMIIGESKSITAKFIPSNASNQSLTWLCLSTGKVTVDSFGVVHALAQGTARIMASYSINDTTEITNNITVTILPSYPPVLKPLPAITMLTTQTSESLNIAPLISDDKTADNLLAFTFKAKNTTITITNDTIFTFKPINTGVEYSDTITITAKDKDNQSASGKLIFKVSMLPNTAPKVSAINAITIKSINGIQTINVIPFATDDYTLPNDLIWSIKDNAKHAVVSVASGIFTVSSPTDAWAGLDSVIVQVTDAGGLSSSEKVYITISSAPNKAPIIATIPSQKQTANSPFATIDLNSFVSDDYTPTSNIMWVFSASSKLSVTETNGIASVTIKDLNWVGAEIISVTAIDEDGEPTSKNVVFLQQAPVGSSWMTKPFVNFTTQNTIVGLGDQVEYSASILGANSWKWELDGANPATSNLLNPVCTYTEPGVYSVKLIAANAKGIDTLIKTDYIKVFGIVNHDTIVCKGSQVKITTNLTNLDTYTWNDGQKTASILPTITKDTIFAVAAQYGLYTYYDTIRITVNKPVSLGADSAVCYGTSLTLNPGLYKSYKWQNGSTTSTFNTDPKTTKTYAVTVVDNNGCISSDNFAVTSIKQLPVSGLQKKDSLCQGSTIYLAAKGAVSYKWTNEFNTQSSTKDSLLVSAAGIYIVSATGINGCIAIDSTKIIVHQLPSVTLAASKGLVCLGDSISLLSSGAKTYTWDNGITAGSTIKMNVLGNNYYNVTGTDANGCSNLASITVVVNNVPELAITSKNVSVCKGQNIILNATGAQTITWDKGVTNGQPFPPLFDGTYVATGINAVGCKDTIHVVLTVKAIPSVTASATKTTICKGDSIQLSSTIEATNSYVWNTVTSKDGYAQPLTTGNNDYFVTATDKVNGCSATDSVRITVKPNAAFTISSLPNDTVCKGSSVSFIKTGDAATYNWSDGLTDAQAFTPNASKTYYVTATLNGCSKTDSIKLVVNALPTINATASKLAVCQGDSTLLSANAETGSTFVWNQTIAINGYSKPSTVGNNDYFVTATNSVTGCQASDSVRVVLSKVPSFNLSSSPNDTVCLGTQITFNKTGDAATYTWSDGLTNGQTFTPAITKNYVVTATANGCSKIDSIHVVVNALPSVNAIVDKQDVCTKSNITLHGEGAKTYVWNNGVTDNTPIAIQATTVFSVTGTDANGCTNTNTITANVHRTFVEQLKLATYREDGSAIIVAWTPTRGKNIDHYELWQLDDSTGNYKVLAKRGATDLSYVVDQNSDAGKTVYSYKLVTYDSTCTDDIAYSKVHNTVHLAHTLSSNPNEVELTWNRYNGINVKNYSVYVYSNEGTLIETILKAVDSSLSSISYTYAKHVAGNKYRIGFKPESIVTTGTLKSDSGPFSQSLSNMAESELTESAITLVDATVTAYPNPSNGKFTVAIIGETAKEYNIELFNSLGQKVFETTTGLKTESLIDIDASTFGLGIYSLQVRTIDGVSTQQVIISR